MKTQKGVAQVSFGKKLQISEIHIPLLRRITRQFARTDAEGQQGVVEGCEEIHKRRRAVEDNMQMYGGTRLQRFLLWLRKSVEESGC